MDLPGGGARAPKVYSAAPSHLQLPCDLAELRNLMRLEMFFLSPKVTLLATCRLGTQAIHDIQAEGEMDRG
jgi:hypothetical protein